MLKYDPNFNPQRVSELRGITLTGNVLSFEEGVTVGSYTYDCGRNQTMHVSLFYEAVLLENLNWGYKEDGSAVIHADVVNRGYHSREGLSVSLVKDSPEGEVLQTKPVGSVESLGLATVSFLVKARENDIYYVVLRDQENRLVDSDYLVIDSESAGDGSGTQEKKWIFTDVSVVPGNWKYEGVRYVYNQGLMGAVGASNQFQPDNQLTRAMFATVLYRMAGEPETAYSSKFSDVAAGKWYSSAILWANSKGIVQGYSDGSYGINDNITREQIAKMLCLYGEAQKYDVSARASLDSFTDRTKVSDWAAGYMQWAVHTGMISGKPNGDSTFRLDPKGQATRAECAKMLRMFNEKYQ
ncbi:MAG: S-layer homology domain-containing protein [Lachnospiraceae bacterium]|nr:S-layer homology domain-containing protein [Lachnospiraceae bacterium]